MKFDIWTLLFQIINFLVLLIILKRILYRPIRDIIEKRRSLIQQRIEESEKVKKEALELKENYQHEIDKLHELKSQMLETMRGEIDEERRRLIGKAEQDAAKVLEKEKAVFDAEKARTEAQIKDQVIESVSVFAGNILRGVVDEDLHKAMYQKLLKDLQGMAFQVPEIKQKGTPLTVDLFTAYPLSDSEITRFRESIESLLAQSVLLNTVADASLIAGVKIQIHDMVYDVSLSSQIKKLAFTLKETA
ncbi:MAG: hypothetical protein AMK71_06705 [Nitrospira bacterium SG8_35_4]|nr:MAG: hypothetical protein AMK71_06705 [Nitrospira bacterium SG8_35_4]